MTVKRLSPAQRREQIIDSASAVIADRGLAHISLRDIARAAGVAIGTVTYHFSSVDEILGAVVIRESDNFYVDLVREADNEEDPWQALWLLIDPLFVDTAKVQAHWQMWTQFWAAVARRPGLADSYANRIRHWQHCCERIIARGLRRGDFRETDPAEMALRLAAYSDGLATQHAQGAGSLTLELAGRWMHDFAELHLRPETAV